MINALDHLIIAVSDIDVAEENYTKIFGVQPVWRGEHKELGTENSLFNFQNTYFELLAAKGEGLGAALVNHYLQESGEGLIGIVLGTEDIDKCYKSLQSKGYALGEISKGEGINFKDGSIREWKNLFLPPELTRGIFAFIIQHTKGSLEEFKNNDKSVVNKLDHLVIQTNDADGFIDIYRDIYNIRLALDKYVEAWESRMLFFRTNKTTIEVIEKQNGEETADKLWGLSWQVDSIEEAHNRLTNQGVEVTPIKKGIKDNTLVATIKSHTSNIPTLLIEHL
ncbi:MAG: VOC family protein [Gammaproteobacteria bacterium]|jgi:catechol 2,3-dioxygenase-like lactoylglutathione lyase family enzyme/predicted enzyme related to lactoylglutathione lyase